MKTSARIISLILVLVTGMLAFSGCILENGSNDYLTKKMNEIPVEFDGYELIPGSMTYSTDQVISIGDTDITVKLGDAAVTIESHWDESWSITFDGKEIVVNDEFMREKSDVYVRIHDIWCNSEKYSEYCKSAGKSKIYNVRVFDDKLFILTNGLKYRWSSKFNVIGFYPITLYVLDLKTEKVYYAGYFSNYGNPEIDVKIAKTEKTEESLRRSPVND